jgi:hydroxymethylpyrimidine/phosphomethylpyrimidine kinase
VLATPPRLLTIAGSDSGGGAGIQADLKTFAAHGAYGMSVVTAVTAQNTRAVTAVHGVPPAVVAAQIHAVFEDIGVDGVKIGMLGDAATVRAVAAALAPHLAVAADCAGRPLPVVLDPVMVAKSGDALLQDDAVEALVDSLLPLATLVTPNLPEAARLTGMSVAELEAEAGRRRAAEHLARTTPAVLIKGGHGGGETVVDLLYDGAHFHRQSHPRITTTATHGTGCTLSSALAVHLAAGVPLAEALTEAVDYLRGAMVAAYAVGSGHGPVNHLYRLSDWKNLGRPR